MPKVYIKESDIAGRGLFARVAIKKGEIVYIAKGKMTHWVVKDARTSATGPNWIGVGKDVWLSPRDGNYLEFTNHSCEPNMAIKGKVTFIALRNIKKDEELTFDYSTTEEDMLWRSPFRCACGSKHCRKIIRSIQHLPSKTFKRYLPYIPAYFQKVYVRYNGLKA
jgi:SET domain-containing protein